MEMERSRERERGTEACTMFARHTEKCGAMISPDSDGCDSSKLMGFCAKANTHISACWTCSVFLVLKEARLADL